MNKEQIPKELLSKWQEEAEKFNTSIQDVIEDANLSCKIGYARGRQDEYLNPSDMSYQELVNKLADWSRKYPRDRIYASHRQSAMDNELILLEDLAKILCPEPEPPKIT